MDAEGETVSGSPYAPTLGLPSAFDLFVFYDLEVELGLLEEQLGLLSSLRLQENERK